MRIRSLRIDNFRGIKSAQLLDLAGTVVVAGPNGCGKSCVFDAIRMLKSIYGGYQANEWHRWISEFQLPQEDGRFNLRPLLNDKTRPLNIEAEFVLHAEERALLAEVGEQEIRRAFHPTRRWTASGLGSSLPRLSSATVPPDAVEKKIRDTVDQLKKELSQDSIVAKITTDPDGEVLFEEAISLELVFSTYRPRKIGLIDYHGPQRFFHRELVQQLNVNLDAHKQQQSQHALYDYAQKYLNIKTELASTYVQEVLAERAGVKLSSQESLTATLQELFSTFFPHKRFDGPVPNDLGLLEFPVIGLHGSVHDLNELSAGEKEILYGYLRIRNSAPRFSMILLDEPELHLNPRLIKDLPHFYTKHLGHALDNQIWLITHSDALIREVVGHKDYSLFHMSPSHHVEVGEPQSRRIDAAEDLEQVIVDLVGDLATYRPGGKLVIFEGGGETEFDVNFTRKLFPKFGDAANFISGESKARVRALHDILNRASAAGAIPFKIFSIADRDADDDPISGAGRYTWDVYHIENYLLEPNFILDVLRSLEIDRFSNGSEILEELRRCATDTMKGLVAHELTKIAADALRKAIELKFDPNAKSAATALSDAVQRTLQRATSASETLLSREKLLEAETRVRESLLGDLASDRWLKTFKGRDILRRFVGDHGQGMSYPQFRTLISSRMADANYQPIGMGQVIAEIVAA